jgi:hypothetical protein
VSAEARFRRHPTHAPAAGAIRKAEKNMQTTRKPSRAAEDGLRLRVGGGILSLVILAAFLAGTPLPF